MILDVLRTDLIAAQKSKAEFRLGVIRYFLAAVKNKEIELRPQGKEMGDPEVLKVLEKQIKKRKDSIEAYKLGKRDDLVKKETDELTILEEYLTKFAPQITA